MCLKLILHRCVWHELGVCARVEERGVEKSRCRKCKETFDLSCVLCKNQAEPTQPHHHRSLIKFLVLKTETSDRMAKRKQTQAEKRGKRSLKHQHRNQERKVLFPEYKFHSIDRLICYLLLPFILLSCTLSQKCLRESLDKSLSRQFTSVWSCAH